MCTLFQGTPDCIWAPIPALYCLVSHHTTPSTLGIRALTDINYFFSAIVSLIIQSLNTRRIEQKSSAQGQQVRISEDSAR